MQTGNRRVGDAHSLQCSRAGGWLRKTTLSPRVSQPGKGEEQGATKGALHPTARLGAVAGWCQGRGCLVDIPTAVLPETDWSCERDEELFREKTFSLIIHSLRLVQCIQESLCEFSSRSGGGKCWWESRTQHPGHSSAHFICAVHSPSSPASPLLLALSPTQPIRNISECCHWMMQGDGMCWAGQSFLLGLRRNQCRNSAGSGMQWRWAGEQPCYTLSIWLSLVSWRKYRSC